MKKYILILIGISLVLSGVIFVLYRNNKESNEEVIDIFKEEKGEEKDLELIKKEEKVEVSTVTVDIKGMVNSPGVYEVENGKRVNDVINMAGGLTIDADTSNINLAKIKLSFFGLTKGLSNPFTKNISKLSIFINLTFKLFSV